MGTHDLRLRLANTAERDGRCNEAAALYAQVLCGNPYLVEAWWGLSQTIGDPDRALYCLKRVVALAPCHAGARKLLEHQAFEVMSDRLDDGPALRASAARFHRPVFAEDGN